MLCSMTGFGEASRHDHGVAASIEIRTVNSRHFKLSLRTAEGYTSFEPAIERLIRRRLSRGTIYVTLRVARDPAPSDYHINEQVLIGYVQQLQKLSAELGQSAGLDQSAPLRLDALLTLPGVAVEREMMPADMQTHWPMIESLLGEALDRLQHMRAEEGKAMTSDIIANCAVIRTEAEQVEARAPLVVENYRTRLNERLAKVLGEGQFEVDAAAIVREVSVFAERCDISEEVVRLRSHLDQIETVARGAEGGGKKLEFLAQEMFREANTIGSKANDVEIAQRVVQMKTAIERLREMAPNLE